MKLWKQITYILKPLIWNTAWKHLQQHPLSWLNQGSHWEHRWLILCWSSNISAFLKAVRTTNLDSHNFFWILSFHFQYAFSTFLVPQWKNIILALNSLTGLNSAGQGKVSFVSKEWIGLKLKLHLLSIFISVIQPNLRFYDPTKSIHEKHFHCINKVTIWHAQAHHYPHPACILPRTRTATSASENSKNWPPPLIRTSFFSYCSVSLKLPQYFLS